MTRTCETCGKPLVKPAKVSHKAFQTRRFCDHACRVAKTPSIRQDYVVTSSGCWEWQGHVDRNGYGKAYDPNMPRGRRVDWAHRVSYRAHVGPIPNGYELDHTCENTVCINPAHLDAVTKAEHCARTFRRLGKDDRHAEAAALRESGLTYAEVADALGMAGQGSAHDAVLAAIRKGLVSPDAVPRVTRLTESQREDIRDLYALGIPQAEIGAWYGVDNSQVSRICAGLTSGHARRAS